MKRGFEYDLVRTERKKSASIFVTPGHVQVLVPKALSTPRIETIVDKNSGEIRRKLREFEDHIPSSNMEFVNGEEIPYLGRRYRLKLMHSEEQKVRLLNGRLCVPVSKTKDGLLKVTEMQGKIVAWYSNRAAHRLSDKVDRYACQVGVVPGLIRIKSMKSRWGSCSSGGKLTFNWRLMMAPNHAVDYVVVHELSHILEPNHGPKFWRLVGRILPNHEKSRAWLKMNGIGLLQKLSEEVPVSR